MRVCDIYNKTLQQKRHLKESFEYAYLIGGRKHVAQVFDCPYSYVGHLASVLNVNLKVLRNERLYKLRNTPKMYNPFIEETELKYYMIGFVLGDGCLERRSNGYVYQLSISSSDIELIEQFSAIFPDARVHGPYKGNYSIAFNDSNICKSLQCLGFVPAKSTVGMSLPKIPKQFRYSFLCGLLDADGTVFHTNNSIDLIWYGHFSYMCDVYKMITSMGYTASLRNHARGTQLYVIRMCTNDECVQLLQQMNTHAPIKFSRKRECTTLLTRRLSKIKSTQVNNFLQDNVPDNRSELLKLCKILQMSESAITKRLVRLGLKYHNKKNEK